MIATYEGAFMNIGKLSSNLPKIATNIWVHKFVDKSVPRPDICHTVVLNLPKHG